LVADSNQLLGGIINGVTIAKSAIKCPDFAVDVFSTNEVTAYEAIEQLCKENNLYFKLVWFSAPDATNTLRVASQVVIYDSTGLQPKHPYWATYGINKDTLVTGKVTNPNYAVNSLYKPTIPTYKLPKFKEDQSNIRNYLVFDGHFASAGAFDASVSALERYEATATAVNQDVYNLPFPAFDIYSGGFLIRGYVTSATTPSTTQFSINSELAGQVVIGDKIILKQDVTYIRTVSNVAGNLITVSIALPLAPVANDIFEVIQQDWINIYEENNEAISYASRGFVKDLKGDQVAKVRWLADRSIPPPGTQLVFYYWPAKAYKRQIKLTESIAKYGLKRADIKIDTVLTKTQIDSLLSAFENQTPNKTIELPECYIPAQSGDIVPVNISNFYTGNLIINEVTGKYGGVKGYELINIYQISMSDKYKEDFNTMLERLTRTTNFKNSGSDNKITKVDESISIGVTETTTISPVTFSEKIVYLKGAVPSRYIYISNLDRTGEVQLTNASLGGGTKGYDANPRLYKNYVTFLRPVTGTTVNNIYLLNLYTNTITQLTNSVTTIAAITKIDTDFDTVYYSQLSGNYKLYSYKISTSTTSQLTSLAGFDETTPTIIESDSSNIYFNRFGGTPTNRLCYISKTGGTITDIATSSTENFVRPTINLSKTKIVVNTSYPGGDDLKILNYNGSNPTRLTDDTNNSVGSIFNLAGDEVYYTGGLFSGGGAGTMNKININTLVKTQVSATQIQQRRSIYFGADIDIGEAI
jgi:Tol biopolymer transport system component